MGSNLALAFMGLSILTLIKDSFFMPENIRYILIIFGIFFIAYGSYKARVT